MTAILTGALTISACGGDSNNDDGGIKYPDATTNADAAADAGTDPVDTGVRPDSGRPDTGVRPDSGPADTGVPDMTNMEGYSCTPGATDQGSCVDATNVCVTWSPESFETQISTCIRPCETDMDCTNSPVGQVCANITIGIQGGVVVGAKGCVASTVGEGQTASASLRNGGPLTGCAEPYQAYPWYLGSLLFSLEDDQASCGLPCGSDMDCTNGRPNTNTPFCNRGILNPETATVTPGICSVRAAGKGSLCSQSSVIEMCDTSESSNVVCVDLGLTEAHNQTAGTAYGYCLEICDQMNPTCTLRNEVTGQTAAACEFGFFTSPTLGLCDDNCSSFPENCTGAGSTPPAGGTNNGMNCAQFGQSFDAPEQGLCLEISQTEELIAPWDFMTAPAFPCADDAHRCPNGTNCIPVDLGAAGQTSACVYGCSTTTSTTGCENAAGFPTCNAVFGAGTTSGVCQQ
ncbi:hypothetical protein L6R52_19045 [Myxococcota bacterium]|nr:hypothetical protein [Myxococcota bacterium]